MYKNFQTCVDALRRQGKSEAAARRMCDKMEKDTEKKNLETRIHKATKDGK